MLYIILIGLAAGAVAGLIIRGKGYGFIINLIVGIAGAYLGNWLFAKLGIHAHGGMLGLFLTALLGAVVLLFILNLLKKILDK
jgi:uncharacterized membrane protein YeaQ/YmgE (transglycosylase-associated protein family)